MRMFNQRDLLAVVLASTSLTAAGCYVEAVGPAPSTGPDTVVVGDYGYEPQYYDGYVVYYDSGRPFYYVNGTRIWISPRSPYYAGYVAHYRTNGGSYVRWYGGTGHRYHTYRGAGGYYGGHRGHINYYQSRGPARGRARYR